MPALPPDPEKLQKKTALRIPAGLTVYLGTLVLVPLFALFVCGFKPFTSDGAAWSIIPASFIESLGAGGVLAVFLKKMSTPAGLILILAGITALVFILREMAHLGKIAKERLYVVLIMTFFSLLFWAIFEQAGSSVNLFTDRNVDRVNESLLVTDADVGKTLEIDLTQEQLGFTIGGSVMTLDRLDKLRDQKQAQASVEITKDHVGMGIAKANEETKATTYQSLNPAYILVLGLVFTALWSLLGAWEPSTPVKFSLGLAQLGLGFGCFWLGASGADDRGMVAVSWLYLGYLLQTTGELCLSPVGLSMVTKLSPARLVSTVMGMWFLATAFSAFLAAIIANFTGVDEHGGGDAGGIPIPLETVDIYGNVFGILAVTGLVSGAICLVLSPFLKRWMHEGEDDDGGDENGKTEAEPAEESDEGPDASTEAPSDDTDESPPAPEGSAT